MYILLEPGTKIKEGDEFYSGSWDSMPTDWVGKMCSKANKPIRHKITTINELVEALGKNY